MTPFRLHVIHFVTLKERGFLKSLFAITRYIETKKMNRSASFAAAFLVLLQIFAVANADVGQNPSNESVGIECLATSADLDSFHCVRSGSPRVACIDEDERCELWASKGECKSNPQYMLMSCRKSCSSCIPLHPGEEPQVAYEHTRSQVLNHLYVTQEYIHEEAKKNVDRLQYCVNNYSDCTHWWAIGECKKNPQFMKQECRAACQTC